MMTTLKDVRRELKKIGYKVTTKRLSWGRHATYHTLDGEYSLTGNVFSAETLKVWQALFDWRKEHQDELHVVANNEESFYGPFYGLAQGKRRRPE
jgi:hypothetical protein